MKIKKKITVNVKYISYFILKCTFIVLKNSNIHAKFPLLASETLIKYMLAFSMKYA